MPIRSRTTTNITLSTAATYAASAATAGNVVSVNTLTFTPHVNTTSVSVTTGATMGMMTANAPDVGDLFYLTFQIFAPRFVYSLSYISAFVN